MSGLQITGHVCTRLPCQLEHPLTTPNNTATSDGVDTNHLGSRFRSEPNMRDGTYHAPLHYPSNLSLSFFGYFFLFWLVMTMTETTAHFSELVFGFFPFSQDDKCTDVLDGRMDRFWRFSLLELPRNGETRLLSIYSTCLYLPSHSPSLSVEDGCMEERMHDGWVGG